MDIFRTVLEPEESPFKISLHDKIMLTGSCFTENIGEKLRYHKFRTDINPFGTIYNPVSIARSLEMLMAPKEFKKADLDQSRGIYFSYYHHGKFSSHDQEECLDKINSRLFASSDFLGNASVLLLTFGTAWVHELKKTGQIVANCHKVPPSHFSRYLLKPGEIVRAWSNVLNLLKKWNPRLQFIFTVSPVRHLNDGMVGNQRSKSVLFVALHQLIEQFPGVVYFPSYEIVMDDLRDYRFFEKNMTHPNEMAVEYIWKKFTRVFLEDDTIRVIDEIKTLGQAMEHRPFNPRSTEYSKFLQTYLKRAKELKRRFPELDFSGEEQFFSRNLFVQ